MMTYIKEELSTPVAGKYDVIVAGGGPSGTAAAVSAARNGMKTLLIEQYSFLGGMWTAGLVNPFFDTENKGGIVRELVDLLKKKNAWGGWQNICFDIETIKLVLDGLVTDSGAEVLFQSFIAGAVTQEETVRGVIVENKQGRQAYLADVVIDCTGDGDVCAFAGAEYEIGRPQDHLCQPMTLMFRLENIDFWQTDTQHELVNLMEKAISENHLAYKIGYRRPCILMLPGQKAAVVQMIHMKGVPPFDAKALSAAYIEARKQIMASFELFSGYIPQLRGVKLSQTACQIGIRESRHIKGEYTLTFNDLMQGRRFEDGIAICAFPIDIHQPDKDDQENYFPKPYHIPYRCLVPERIDGLLAAGRCISGTHEAHASYRVTGSCMAIGEAAGAAAAMAVKNNIRPRDIDSSGLVRLLREKQGVLL